MYRCEVHDIPRLFKAKLTDNSDWERVKVVIEQASSLSRPLKARLTRGGLKAHHPPSYLGERYFIQPDIQFIRCIKRYSTLVRDYLTRL